MQQYFQKVLSKYYDLGRLIDIKQSHRGYINETFEIKLLKNAREKQFVLRRYRKGTSKQRITFEHALLGELIKQNFHFTPHVIPTRNKATVVKLSGDKNDRFDERYISVFSRLPGQDKYCWNQPLCTYPELNDAARVLALYHFAISDWEGVHGWVGQRTIDSVASMSARWRSYAQHPGTSSFDKYFLEQFEYIYGELGKIQSKPIYNEMIHLAIHGDYHPGNLKFDNEKVIGVLDLDWSKMDLRCFDVALALLYFCSSWDAPDEGHILLDRTESFLESYQKVSAQQGRVGPLDTMELTQLPEMIHLGNLSIIDWILEEFYSTVNSPQEYETYLRHSIKVMRWMQSHWDRLCQRMLKLGGIQ